MVGKEVMTGGHGGEVLSLLWTVSLMYSPATTREERWPGVS